MSRTAKLSAAEHVALAKELRALLPRVPRVDARAPQVYVVLKYLASSGASRTLQLLVPVRRKRGLVIEDISPDVAKLLGRKYDASHGGVRCDGGGMDMGFEVVYALSTKLYGAAARGGYAVEHVWL